MPVVICPRCKQRLVASKNTGPDIQHQCNSKVEALDYHSEVKIGDWTDADGTSGTVANPSLQGYGSLAGGKKTGLANIDRKNIHGKRLGTHRYKKHTEFIELR